MKERQVQAEDPDIKLAGLSLWTLSREFPDSDDYWDGNWLNVRARVEAPGAYVEVRGPLIRIDELSSFRDQLAVLNRDLRGTAELECLEPGLNVKVACDVRGQVEVTVEATPDHLSQEHRFVFSIDQSYLAETLSGCRKVLDQFPVKSAPEAS